MLKLKLFVGLGVATNQPIQHVNVEPRDRERERVLIVSLPLYYVVFTLSHHLLLDIIGEYWWYRPILCFFVQSSLLISTLLVAKIPSVVLLISVTRRHKSVHQAQGYQWRESIHQLLQYQGLSPFFVYWNPGKIYFQFLCTYQKCSHALIATCDLLCILSGDGEREREGEILCIFHGFIILWINQLYITWYLYLNICIWHMHACVRVFIHFNDGNRQSYGKKNTFNLDRRRLRSIFP